MNDVCETITIEESSGNVFADLGCKDAEQKQAKANIAINIRRAINDHKLTQSEAARRLGIDQPTISRLLKGQLKGFSTDRLLKFLTALDQDVTITIRPSNDHGRISVVA